MNEPFSEKSARQVIQQSGQFSLPSEADSSVSAQSVYPQNRHTNSQQYHPANYPMNRMYNRPAESSPHRREESPSPLHAEPSQEIRNGKNVKQETVTEETVKPCNSNAVEAAKPHSSNAAEAAKSYSCNMAEATKPHSSNTAENINAETVQTGRRESEKSVLLQNIQPANPPGGRQEGQGHGCGLADSDARGYSIAYHAAMPYPPVKVAGPNRQYGTAMLDNVAGQNSEMSAVGLYLYDHLIASGHKEIADAFHSISIVEMRHLEIFSELAMQLGENPRLWSRHPKNGRYLYWNPACLHYPHVQPPASGCPLSKAGLRLILTQAIEGEQAAVRKYMNQTSWIKDENICDNLRRIAADEQMHVDIYTRLYHSL